MEKSKIIRINDLVDFIKEYLKKNVKPDILRKGLFNNLIKSLSINLIEGLNKGHAIEIRDFAAFKKVLIRGRKWKKLKDNTQFFYGDYYDIKLKIAKSFKKKLNPHED